MSSNSHPVPAEASSTWDHHPAGHTIERHRHLFHQLIYVSSGVFAVRTQEAAWVISSARAMWVPAGTWHQHRVYGSSRVHTFGFATDDPPLPGDVPTMVFVGPFLRELLIACSEPGLPLEEAGRIQAVIRDRLRRSHIQPLVLPAPQDARLAQACALAEDDLTQPRTVTWLARHCGASERTLTRLFRTEFGMTYPQWRTTVRVFHAMIKLAEGATVTEAGQDCGWATTSAFVNAFTRTAGQTPGAYRTTMRAADRAAAAPPS
ncbi:MULTISPECIES: helix-turn-helix transcriptional regulator [Streptomyces]|uniref:helix-turn-helix transcriptional regulator n=1 Tax=Streptomyces TaxID=1883 RepID=UPI0003FC45F8|nr:MULTISPECIES: helix-turn-helix transcriptional regulator [unclassified Streptomyces]NEC40883.1 AraC family transcriptional regulator [Streptomyces sp. SID8016]NEC64691.1 AraC family transcriptional regulator [Streptomyces sp. SID9727]